MPRRSKQKKDIPSWLTAESVSLDLRRIMSHPDKDIRLTNVASNWNGLGKLIWAFREAHGWEYTNGKHVVPRRYFSHTVPKYSKNRVSKDNFSAIRFVSTPKAIDAIRQRGRLRQPQTILDKKTVSKLSKEMNSALRWILTKKE